MSSSISPIDTENNCMTPPESSGRYRLIKTIYSRTNESPPSLPTVATRNDPKKIQVSKDTRFSRISKPIQRQCFRLSSVVVTVSVDKITLSIKSAGLGSLSVAVCPAKLGDEIIASRRDGSDWKEFVPGLTKCSREPEITMTG
jgi:hypothetical protein